MMQNFSSSALSDMLNYSYLQNPKYSWSSSAIKIFASTEMKIKTIGEHAHATATNLQGIDRDNDK